MSRTSNMVLPPKCLFPPYTSGLIFFVLCLNGILSYNLVNTKEFNKGNRNTHLLENIAHPARGLTTGHPLKEPAKNNTGHLFHTNPRTQTSTMEDAQAEKPLTKNRVDSKNRPITAGTLGMEVVGLGKAWGQRLQDVLLVTPLPLICRWVCGGAADNAQHPAKDPVQLYNAVNNIMAHVTGFERAINGPDWIRMREYVGVRRPYGVQVILQGETHFWENNLTEEDALKLTNVSKNSAPVEGLSVTLRQVRDFQEESILEEEANIDVKEGARLRLVCNVTGVPTYRVEWRRGTNLIVPWCAFVVGTPSILLDYVGREDAGVYFCTATTTPSGYSHSSAVSIKVQYAPVVGVWARDMDNNKVELGCLIEGRPRPSSAWYMNNTKISSSYYPRNLEIRSSMLSSHFVLSVMSLTNITKAYFAYYQCRASNSARDASVYIMVQDDTV